MMKAIRLSASLAVACASQALADDAEIERGQAVFERTCAACHGAGPGDDGAPQLPGTATLARRYEGALPGELEKRDDLTPETLSFFIRNGIGAMPMFRKTEISDAEIEALATYLAHAAQQP